MTEEPRLLRMFRKTRRRVRALEGRVFAVEDSGRETWERVDAQDVRIGALEKRLDELWPYAQLLEERIEELEDKAKSHGAALDNLHGRHERLSQRVTEMEKSGMTTGEKVFELEQVVARYQERVDALDGHSHIDAQEKVAERLRRMVAPPPPVIKDGEYADHPLKRSRKDREFRRRIIEALRQAQNGKLYFIEEVYDHIHEAVYGEE